MACDQETDINTKVTKADSNVSVCLPVHKGHRCQKSAVSCYVVM